MAFFCPIFPSKQNRIKAKEYEDSNYYSFDGGGRSLYSSRSMTALNFVAGDENLAESVDQQKSFDSTSSSRMLMINSNFDPTVDDELRVRRGDVVKALYRDRDWIYVVRGETEEGFVPAIFCQDASSAKRPEKSQLSIFKSAFTRRSTRAAAKNQEPVNHDSIDDEAKKSVIREKALMNVDRFLKSLDESPNYARIEKEKNRYGAIMEFRKRPHGKLRAEYKFEARNEDDVSVKEGEILLLLNNDDPDWFWVRREDGAEGFVPSNYVQKINGGAATTEEGQKTESPVPFNELMIIADFEPEAADDLKVIRGDWIYSYQTPALVDNTWLWAYCPRTKRYGFVPNSIVRTPTATVL